MEATVVIEDRPRTLSLLPRSVCNRRQPGISILQTKTMLAFVRSAVSSDFASIATDPGDIVFAEDIGLGHVLTGSGLHKSTIDLDTGKTLYTLRLSRTEWIG